MNRLFGCSVVNMKKCVLIILLLLCKDFPAIACTSAIISGRATPDGRPLLWKQRDARKLENSLMFFRGEKFDFIGVIDTTDTTGSQVWMGSNSAGFSILDTNAYNLDKGRFSGPMDREGFLMKEVLGRCATLADFEQFLQRTKGTWGVQANFGAIDAQGGAAYYEATPYGYEKFDVNDPKVAPSGYLIRTNFGLSGQKEGGGGYIRYRTAEDIFYWNHLRGNLSAEFLIVEASRCLKHSLLGTDVATMMVSENESDIYYVPFLDYIAGSYTSSAMIVQGVKKGDDPRLTTLWTILGWPPATLTVPIWVAAGDNLPEAMTSKYGNTARLNEMGLLLKERCFPLPAREGQAYLNVPPLLNTKGTGILAKIAARDKETITEANGLLSTWRQRGFSTREALNHYKRYDSLITEFYKKNFQIDAQKHLSADTLRRLRAPHP
jgi:hypothetical protein